MKYLWVLFAPVFPDTTLDKEFIPKLQTACKFYLLALQNAEQEPEIAYLHLIMAGGNLGTVYLLNI